MLRSKGKYSEFARKAYSTQRAICGQAAKETSKHTVPKTRQFHVICAACRRDIAATRDARKGQHSELLRRSELRDRCSLLATHDTVTDNCRGAAPVLLFETAGGVNVALYVRRKLAERCGELTAPNAAFLEWAGA